MLSFKEGSDGRVCNVLVAKSSGFTELDKEACRVGHLLHDFELAQINGRPVGPILDFPIKFQSA